MIQAITEGRPLTKENLQLAPPVKYILSKISVIQQELRNAPSLLDSQQESEDELLERILLTNHKGVKSKKPKDPKEKKTNTYEVTFNFHTQGMSLDEIARERQLSATTIEGHFARLIQQERIDLSEVIPEERIKELENYFDGYEETTVGALKEKLGDAVSWGELKMYQAYTLR
jgi:uncharacterized protein YpbB